MNKGIGQYKQIGVETAMVNASPHRLIQMLYEGALTQLANAKGSIQNDQIEQLSICIKKVSNILVGLEEGLDFEKGGDIAVNLQALYQYMQTELVSAQVLNSVEKIDALIELMVELKSAWDAIDPEKKTEIETKSD